MTAVENKIPDVRNLVQITDYDVKISEIESKYITTTDYNKFTKNIADNSIRGKNLVTETYFDAKLQNLNKNTASNKTKHLLVESELKNYKNLIQVILEIKNILVMMVLKII